MDTPFIIIAIAGAMPCIAILLSKILGWGKLTNSSVVNRYECGIRNHLSGGGFVYRSEYGALIAMFIIIEAATIFTLIICLLGRSNLSP
ncbi:MAG: hypothetical protein LBL32_01600 [Holosporales bacterium]|jgi:NADH:ubiquinone oxidoreductase subunit 3 (subunit A)|nr:hypothetical protein [Holosporales bacterium]